MKKIFKILSLVLVMAILGALLAGCSANTQTLKVATNAEFEPFESIENGEYVGFDIDLINKIASELNMEAEFNNMEFDAVIAALPSNTCDIAVSGLTINDTRKKSVDFSVPYYEVSQYLIVRKDDTTFTGTTKAELDEQLKNKKIGACTGYTGQAYIEGDADWGFEKVEGAQLGIYDNSSAAIEDLKNGKIDTFILDGPVALKAAAADVNKNDIKVIEVALTVEKYAIAVKKGNTELLDKINNVISQLKSSGELDTMLANWGLE